MFTARKVHADTVTLTRLHLLQQSLTGLSYTFNFKSDYAYRSARPLVCLPEVATFYSAEHHLHVTVFCLSTTRFHMY